MNDDGVIATAAIVRLIDYNADYRIHQRLIPKKERDENGTLLGVSFKKTDVIVFFVSAMWKVKRRPLFVYADNDDRLNLKSEFSYVTEPAEKPIEMISPRPGEPWPRGLQEGGFSRSQIRLLRRYTGYYSKKNRSSIRKAIANPAKLPTPKQMEEQVAAFDENMNNEPRIRPARGKATGPTRADIYNQHINPRPCPPIRRLFRIMPADHREEGWVQLDGLGFDFSTGGEKHFVPIAASKNGLPDLWIDWMDAKLSKEPSHYFAIKLNMGWVAEICLMGHWYEAVPRSKNPYDQATRKQAIDDAVSKLKQRASDQKARIIAEALERDGALPERDNVSVRGKYYLPPRPTTPAAVNGTIPDNDTDSGRSRGSLMAEEGSKEVTFSEQIPEDAPPQGDQEQQSAMPPTSTDSDAAHVAESGGKTSRQGAQSEQGERASATGKPSQRRKRSTPPLNGKQTTPPAVSGGEVSGEQSDQGNQARATGQSAQGRKRSTAQQNGGSAAPRKTKLDWEDLF